MDRNAWTGIDVNVRGVQNVLEACRACRVQKLIFASSNAVYGYGSGVKGDLVENTPFHSAEAPPAAGAMKSSLGDCAGCAACAGPVFFANPRGTILCWAQR